MVNAISPYQLSVISLLVKAASHLEGDMAELGVFEGGSAKIISSAAPSKILHLYDTFEGLPYEEKEYGHKKGDFCCSLDEVKENLKGCNVEYHPGIFPSTAQDKKYCFVHLDADQYQSTKDGIEFFWPRIVDGGILTIDDTSNFQTLGVRKALIEYFKDMEVGVHHNSVHICKNSKVSFSELDYLYEGRKLFPEDPAIKAETSYASCRLERWKEFYLSHELRIGVYPFLKTQYDSYPQEKKWTGQDLKNKRIVLVIEQGIGDNIQFLRFAKLVKELGAEVVMYASTHFAPLLEMQSYIDFVFTRRFPKDYDYWCPLLSIGAILELDYLPNDPYITISEFQKYPGAGKKDIGIVWAGNPVYSGDQHRSCPLKHFAPLFEREDLRIWSLQTDKRKRCYSDNPDLEIDLSEHPDEWQILDLSEHLSDWYCTAGWLKGLDMLISVDTACLHLAAAMGVPSIALLPKDSCWRWGLKETTPWYPGMRIARQKTKGDWDSAFSTVLDLLPRQ